MQVCAFVAPKIIGGAKAPSPVGELGMVQMSQALKLSDVSFEQVRVQIINLYSIHCCNTSRNSQNSLDILCYCIQNWIRQAFLGAFIYLQVLFLLLLLYLDFCPIMNHDSCCHHWIIMMKNIVAYSTGLKKIKEDFWLSDLADE